MSDLDSAAKWQNAYLNNFQPSSVGRLIKGTIHNLNGVIQAFSMQTELFEMMFAKADSQLNQAMESISEESARQLVTSTRELLHKRQAMLARMEEKINYSQQLLDTTAKIANASSDKNPIFLTSLLENIVAFFHSDMFFKHKVQTSVDLQVPLQLYHHRQELCIIMLCLMENCIAAMQDNPDQVPQCSLKSRQEGDRAIIELCNNGPQIPTENAEQIFQPFFTSRPNQAGLGLYLARHLAASCQGEINFTSSAEQTCFSLNIPTSDM